MRASNRKLGVTQLLLARCGNFPPLRKGKLRRKPGTEGKGSLENELIHEKLGLEAPQPRTESPLDKEGMEVQKEKLR